LVFSALCQLWTFISGFDYKIGTLHGRTTTTNIAIYSNSELRFWFFDRKTPVTLASSGEQRNPELFAGRSSDSPRGPINNRKDVFLRRKTSFFEERRLSSKKDVFLQRKTSFVEERRLS